VTLEKEVFIDSSAIFVMGDRSSEEGEAVEEFLLTRRTPLVTTNFILAETLSLVTKRIGKTKGIEVGEKVISSGIIRLIYLEEALQREAWQFYKKYRDKDFDFIDATSFVYCKQQGIREVLTLDHHFTQMGFTIFPK
jgi:predicted nucleic acid-binding protein